MRKPFAVWFRELPVRRRLMLLVAIGALPFAVYLGLDVVNALNESERQLEVRARVAAEQIGARIESRMGDVDHVLKTLTHTMIPDAEHVDENNRRLNALRAELPPYLSNLVVRDRFGTIVGAADPSSVLRGPVVDRPFFRDALHTGRRVVEAPVISQRSNELVALIGRPVLIDNRVVGVVGAALPLADVAATVAAYEGLPEQSRVEVRNASGQLASFNRGLSRSLRESEVVSATVDTGFDDWTVTVTTPISPAKAPIHAQLKRHLLVSALVLFGSFVLASAVAAQLGRGLRRLADDAELIGRGASSHRTLIRGDDELGRLGATLNRMADDLAAREAALVRSDNWLRAIADNVPVLIGYVSSDQRYEFMNDFGAHLLGRDRSDIIGRPIGEVRGEVGYGQVREPLLQALRDGMPATFQHEYVRASVKRHLSITYLPDYDDQGAVRGAYVLGIDLTESKRSELALRDRESMFRSIADNLPVLIAIVDRSLCYSYCNATYRTWTGIDPERLSGKPVVEVLGEQGLYEELPYMDRALSGKSVTFERTGEIGGRMRHMLKTFIPRTSVERPDQVIGFYVLGQDVTARRELEQSLEHMARCDQLTGLPNRYLLQDRLAQACHRSVRDATQLALFFLDLDGFKPINDKLGHSGGDIVLRTIGERLRGAVRMSDTVCRYGGDEFVVLLEGFASYRQLETMAARLIELVEEPIVVGEVQVRCSTSVGVSTYPPSRSWQELIEAADAAMYEAKSSGPGRYTIAPIKAQSLAEPATAA